MATSLWWAGSTYCICWHFKNCSDTWTLKSCQIYRQVKYPWHYSSMQMQRRSYFVTNVLSWGCFIDIQGNEIKQMLQDLAPEFTDVLLFYLASMWPLSLLILFLTSTFSDNFQAIAQQFGLDTKDDRLVVLYPPKVHMYHYTVTA